MDLLYAGTHRCNESLFFLFFPPIGDVGAVVCPRKALKAPTECCAKRSVEPHPLTTIDSALRLKETSLMNS